MDREPKVPRMRITVGAVEASRSIAGETYFPRTSSMFSSGQRLYLRQLDSYSSPRTTRNNASTESPKSCAAVQGDSWFSEKAVGQAAVQVAGLLSAEPHLLSRCPPTPVSSWSEDEATPESAPPAIANGVPARAAWVFTRSHGVWVQQGNKLVGATSEYGGGLWSQGASVALSADGSTAIVGGPSDNRTVGAAWVFTRTDGVWTQQGNKLVGTGAYRAGELALLSGQGMAVALSADGNTAIVGGWGAEVAWVFTRNASGVWTQEGKLVGDGAVGRAHRGMSVALSADGNTAIVGGWSDNSKTGAAWVFSRSGGVWRQQGRKLVGTGAVGSANQGWSVALSADGNTAIVGGPGDNLWDPSVPFGLGGAGAAWVFTRNGSGWT